MGGGGANIWLWVGVHVEMNRLGDDQGSRSERVTIEFQCEQIEIPDYNTRGRRIVVKLETERAHGM